jgi:hypothetical protein
MRVGVTLRSRRDVTLRLDVDGVSTPPAVYRVAGSP